MPDGAVTIGELSRSLVALEGRINSQFATVNRRLDNLEFVPRGEYELQIANLKSDLRELEDSKKWIIRTLVAAFVFPMIIVVLTSLMVLR